ncbi:MAG: dihydroneopterin aldolase [Reinekea sp.]|jgi:7,8-dihydroneopterin aldolase/epimerase/oxygenase
MDKVYIEGLEVETLIGVYEHERHSPQPLFLDLWLDHDCSKAANTDNLQFTLDYDRLSKRIRSWSSRQKFELLERYAQQLCDLIHQEFGIYTITLKINKPKAVLGCQAVGIQIQRRYS